MNVTNSHLIGIGNEDDCGPPGWSDCTTPGTFRFPRYLEPEKPGIVVIPIVVLTAEDGNHLR
jgi:hypothetical protein